ncbi:TRAP-type mannitol/chloroaromatic compound transport system, small permease component [Thalassovita gelatinovora]|uniref:TRAP transporter small permease protein n=1 Tax=Thalassovita gelatinovora TaxID=53501 RepID=A0A0P1F3L0_THAGE|nr:TRAP transporter small permease [Thalassovita gelatinovora]QIZ81784.1 TRAP transporter small permease [Thalassovita gelatinovora]CUH62324.1 TRAP-type mannitol/chloroaromatic compound transport system, small permease component [Thalassovita gelatinovora]SER15677.1 TRAP-type C4-dicarboxylate transport system, small permease component [Thalassovita gelatinovora]
MSLPEINTDKGPGAFSPLDRGLQFCRKLGRGATWVSGFALITVCALVMVEVLLRKFVGVTLGGMDEITGYVLAVAVTWTLAFALLEQAHIRIDVLYNLANRRTRAALDLISLVSMTGFMLLLTYWAGQLLTSTLQFGSTSNSALQVPLWLPQSLWVGGLVFFSLTLVLLCLRTFGYLLRGDAAAITRIVGIKAVEEEVEEQAAPSRLDHVTQG